MRQISHQRMRRAEGQLRRIPAGGRRILACAGIAAALLSLGSGPKPNLFAQAAQQPQPWPPMSSHSEPLGRDGAKDPFQRRQEEKLAAARNAQRQQQLVRDTDKLLALATELKAEVDKTNKDVLSVSVVKKAEEIEKLAKSVKDKMRQ